MVPQSIPELGIKLGQSVHRRALGLPIGWRTRGTSALATTGCRWHFIITERSHWREAHAGGIRIFHFSVDNFLGEVKSLGHYLHVGLHNRISKSTKFLLILLLDNIAELFFADVIILQEGGYPEESAEEGIPLHTQLKVLS